jgi:hypothetical protein
LRIHTLKQTTTQKLGAMEIIQRLASALDLNIHFNVLFFDWV